MREEKGEMEGDEKLKVGRPVTDGEMTGEILRRDEDTQVNIRVKTLTDGSWGCGQGHEKGDERGRTSRQRDYW